MKFKTELERAQHPKAKLIPISLWERLNKEYKADTVKQFIETEDKFLDSLGALLPKGLMYYALPKGYVAWQCIALTHTDAIGELINLAGEIIQSNETRTLSITLMLFIDTKNEAIIRDYFSILHNNSKLDELFIPYYDYNFPYRPFQRAVQTGQLWLIKWLEQIINNPKTSLEMIQRDVNFESYCGAAFQGSLDVLDYLRKILPLEHLQAIIAQKKFAIYHNSAKNDHIGVLKHLEEIIAPKHRLMMIEAKDFEVYCHAIIHGKINILKHIEEIIPQEQCRAKIKNFSSYYCTAASSGYLEILKHFEKIIYADDFKETIILAYYHAGINGHLNILEYLEEFVGQEQIPYMIRAYQFGVYGQAAENHQIDVLNHLEQIVLPEDLPTMIQAKNFAALRLAAQLGQFNHLRDLMDLLSFEKLQKMIEAQDFIVFQYAVSKHHAQTYNYLLSQSAKCFVYAEMHRYQYENIIFNFLQNSLNELHFQALNTSEVFDIANAEQVKLCFYMIRHLIRRNDRIWDEELRFLLSIPSVRVVAHQEVTRGQANELLQLAITTNNQQAAEILLDIDAVRQLAEQNNYYRVMSDGLNLRQLIRNRESSMTALSQEEQERLDAAIKHYQPVLDSKGIATLINELRAQLRIRYEKNPAVIQDVKGSKIKLPMNFNALKTLGLKTDDYGKALKAYYQHKDHSAWRYLLKPNPWMHPNASVVYVDEQGGRYAMFEEYLPFIAMLWIAVSDKEMAPTEDWTIEGRIEHFINELAFIGRAHNWDKKRINPRTGNEEEYDDEEGDRPSCYSGVKRRLFQAGLGHPLFAVLDADKILNEIRMFARDHILPQINSSNKEAFKEAFEDFMEKTNDMAEKNKALLISLNIPVEKQKAFQDYLVKKYKEHYSKSIALNRLVQKKLTWKEVSSEYNCHALNLDGLIGLYKFLCEASEPTATRVSEIGLFSSSVLPQSKNTKKQEWKEYFH